MSLKSDWFFDALWEFSDKALAAEMPALAKKLEEAMDTYLIENRVVSVLVITKQSDGKQTVKRNPSRISAKLARQIDAQKEITNFWTQHDAEPDIASARSRISA